VCVCVCVCALRFCWNDCCRRNLDSTCRDWLDWVKLNELVDLGEPGWLCSCYRVIMTHLRLRLRLLLLSFSLSLSLCLGFSSGRRTRAFIVYHQRKSFVDGRSKGDMILFGREKSPFPPVDAFLCRITETAKRIWILLLRIVVSLGLSFG
jgi:hypothetical protein